MEGWLGSVQILVRHEVRNEAEEGARDGVGDGRQAIHEVAVEVAWRSDQAANGASRRRCSGGWGRGSREGLGGAVD